MDFIKVSNFHHPSIPMLTIQRHLPLTTPPIHHTLPNLTDSELVEIRAAQRTFEGAYIRTALGQFAFALVVLRIFSAEFYAVGALFAAYGACIALTAVYRRHQGNRQFFIHSDHASGEQTKKFRTSGNVVVMMTVLSLTAYVTLLVLILKLKNY